MAQEGKKIDKQRLAVGELEQRFEDGYKVHYSNVANVGYTPWDIQIRFSEVRGGGMEGKPHVLNKTAVTISPDHAIRLFNILRAKLEEWREDVKKQTGVDPMPDGLKAIDDPNDPSRRAAVK